MWVAVTSVQDAASSTSFSRGVDRMMAPLPSGLKPARGADDRCNEPGYG